MSLEKDEGGDEVRHRCGSYDSNGAVDVGDSADDDQAAQDENHDIDHDVITRDDDGGEDSKKEKDVGEDEGASAALTRAAEAPPPSTKDAGAASAAVSAAPSPSKRPLVPVPGRPPSTSAGESDANGAETSKTRLVSVEGRSPSSVDSRRSTAVLASDGTNRTCATSGAVPPGDAQGFVIGPGSTVIGIGYDSGPQPGAYRVNPTSMMQLSDDDASRRSSWARDESHDGDLDASDNNFDGIIVYEGEAVVIEADATRAPPPLPPLVDARRVDDNLLSPLVPKSRRGRMLLAFVTAVVLAGVVSAIIAAVVASVGTNDNEEDSSVGDAGGDTPSPVPVPSSAFSTPSPTPTSALSSAPTAGPSSVPSSSPTLSSAPSLSPTVTSMPTQSREGRLLDLLATVTTEESLLFDDDSPQGRARRWIVEQDGSHVDSTMDPVGVVQRYVLAVVHYSTDGDGSWRVCGPVDDDDDTAVPCEPGDDTRWLSSSHECEWAFVSCDGTAVTKLELHDGVNSAGTFVNEHGAPVLNGTIPSEIGHLSHLRTLQLSGNPHLTGTVPWDALLRLEMLEQIDLGRCGLTGPLLFNTTSAATSNPHAWSSLQLLNLEVNAFSGSLPVDTIWPPNLVRLWLARNNLTGPLPSTIGSLTKLKTLSLHTNNFTGNVPDTLGNLMKLEALFLQENSFIGGIPEAICALRVPGTDGAYGLRSLFVDCALREGCQCCSRSDCDTDNPPQECECIDRTYLLEEAVLGSPGALTALPLQSPEYQAFNWLWEFDPRHVHPDLYPTIKQRYAMAVLYYSWGGGSWDVCNGSYISLTPSGHTDAPCPTGGVRWLSSEPECRWFGAKCDETMNVREIEFESPNNIQGSIPGDVGTLLHLQRIVMPGNRLSSDMPSEMLELVELKAINFSSNALSGALWENLDDMVRLDSLDLSHNNLGGSLTEVKFPPDLKVLDLHGNQFTGDLSTLANLARLETLYLQGNDFVGNAPSQICNVRNTTFLFENSTFVMDCVEEVTCTCCTDCCVDDAESSQLHLTDRLYITESVMCCS